MKAENCHHSASVQACNNARLATLIHLLSAVLDLNQPYIFQARRAHHGVEVGTRLALPLACHANTRLKHWHTEGKWEVTCVQSSSTRPHTYLSRTSQSSFRDIVECPLAGNARFTGSRKGPTRSAFTPTSIACSHVNNLGIFLCSSLQRLQQESCESNAEYEPLKPASISVCAD